LQAFQAQSPGRRRLGPAWLPSRAGKGPGQLPQEVPRGVVHIILVSPKGGATERSRRAKATSVEVGGQGTPRERGGRKGPGTRGGQGEGQRVATAVGRWTRRSPRESAEQSRRLCKKAEYCSHATSKHLEKRPASAAWGGRGRQLTTSLGS